MLGRIYALIVVGSRQRLAVESGYGYSIRMLCVSRDVQSAEHATFACQRDDLQVWFLRNEVGGLSLVIGLALVIRLYLTLTSYCISGDGAAYVAMARHFSDRDWGAALGAVYSPLYPALISLMHRYVSEWETAGNLVSAGLGTAAVATTYLMTRDAFGSRGLGFGAAALMAVHPAIAAYSASVRTEAGYMFFTTVACWLLIKALNEQRIACAISAGIAAGLGYLYRTEAAGFLLLGLFLFLVAGWSYKELSRAWVLLAAVAFGAAYTTIAAPYIVYLRIESGHWSIGREFTTAMMYGMGDVAQNGGEWRQLGWSADASPFRAIYTQPQLYAEKVGQYLLVSLYSFAQALEPIFTVMLAIGIWARRPAVFAKAGLQLRKTFHWSPRALLGSPSRDDPTSLWAKLDRVVPRTRVEDSGVSEAQPVNQSETRRVSERFLAAVVFFYFGGFALTYTGTRFMVHLLPFIFGWVAAGIIFISEKAGQWCSPASRTIGHAIVPAAIGITLLPRTLWPLGYDMRGMRYAGADIARIKKAAVVAARDGRVAYYAGARLVELPPSPPQDLCAWLRVEGGDFLMIGNHDEQLFSTPRNQRCLELLKRYPRYGSGYYDLYAVRVLDQAGGSGRTAAGIAPP